MATRLTEKKKYTIEDYMKTPDDVRYELIEGELLMTPSPITKHQRAVGSIYFKIREYLYMLNMESKNTGLQTRRKREWSYTSLIRSNLI